MGRTGLMASTTTSAASSDLARHHLLPPLSPVDGGRGLGSMNMDDLFQNMYAPESLTVVDPISREVAKSVDEVWKEISGERKMGGGGAAAAMGYSTEMTMTLEDYLARAGVVGEGEVGGMVVQQQQGVLERGTRGVVMDYGQQQRQQKVEVEGAFMGYGNGGTEGGGGGGGGGRGRRRVVQDQADKVAQQKQRRMIKNRESAARSRERKQAHTVELESLVAQLEEENSALKQQQEEQRRKRLKQLLETRIPTVERKKPQHRLRKTLSMQ